MLGIFWSLYNTLNYASLLGSSRIKFIKSNNDNHPLLINVINNHITRVISYPIEIRSRIYLFIYEIIFSIMAVWQHYVDAL